MTRSKSHHQQRQIRIRSVRRDPPDLRKLASALNALAQAQAEADAEVQHHHEAIETSGDTKPSPEDKA